LVAGNEKYKAITTAHYRKDIGSKAFKYLKKEDQQ